MWALSLMCFLPLPIERSAITLTCLSFFQVGLLGKCVKMHCLEMLLANSLHITHLFLTGHNICC